MKEISCFPINIQASYDERLAQNGDVNVPKN